MAQFTIYNRNGQKVGSVDVVFTTHEDSTYMRVFNTKGKMIGSFSRYGWGFSDRQAKPRVHCELSQEPWAEPTRAKFFRNYFHFSGGVDVDGHAIYRASNEPMEDGVEVGRVGNGVWTNEDEELIQKIGKTEFGDSLELQAQRRVHEKKERELRMRLYAQSAGCGALFCDLL